ncbi:MULTISPECIES: tetratricopeptide repeat protein [unclassified Synechocystis]|uniref:tetratricopeptide repeat protein n=1 Tax=unclassified Synechocystis TaxID=2640012 RepID=UPI00041DAC7D|nr:MULTISPECIES: tetratricopeptide repeat protein [unclassified Synechocystis]AIE74258.1 TPR repeat protein [Synechocystis sp. PCC 6714]MCT0254950.1 tetratricopeptide repeat protein [Synechocystis sp. CS-94]
MVNHGCSPGGSLLPLAILGALSLVFSLPLVAQDTIDSDRSLPLMNDHPLEERLIDGMDEGIKKNYRGAITIFTELILLDPSYADAYFNRGIARARIADYQGAIADHSQAIVLNPQFADAYKARGKIYWQLGDQEQAIADLETALTLFSAQENMVSQQQTQEQLQTWRGNP